ncbi:DUF6461 domain-containing protein [Candidatus Frankia nodulisporulans]|uniref:DUF6461 domain-containing protein n=1 Tax=Candidatus Frankia nodulisporulans TaxID=2060052 RepID=UPI0013D6C8EE|nr:DUF6461 domain-containing protein [Candidatus Frankia nodulisporulans]
MSEIDAATMAVVVRWVLEVAPTLAERIPAPVAVALGRLGASLDPAAALGDGYAPRPVGWVGARGASLPPPGLPWPGFGRAGSGSMVGPSYSQSEDSAVLGALRAVGVSVADRLLGALELTVNGLRPAPVIPVPVPVSRGHTSRVQIGVVNRAGGSIAARAVRRLHLHEPHVCAFVEDAVAALTEHPAIADLLAPASGSGSAPGSAVGAGGDAAWLAGLTEAAYVTGPPGWPGNAPADDPAEAVAALAPAAELVEEAWIAARHGARALALGIATAAAIMRRADGSPYDAATIVGLGLGSTAVHLAHAPMPAAYGPALFARRRRLFTLPRAHAGLVDVHGHVFGLLEGDATLLGAGAADARFADNGLVALVPGGLLVRTGRADGPVNLCLEVLAEAPNAERTTRQLALHDEIVEVSWHAEIGFASVVGAGPTTEQHEWREQSPPWPGDYRVRVAARGRDHDSESYELLVWSAPLRQPLVLRQTDRLGHRLRGQPEPPPPPEEKYHWIRSRGCVLCEAATITIVVGTDRDEVVRIFGANPVRPRSLHSLMDAPDRVGWLAAMNVPGTDIVVVMEENSFAGSHGPTIADLSLGGHAGSVFWNVNVDNRLSLARGGDLLLAEESLDRAPRSPALAPLFHGLDLTRFDWSVPKGLLVLERLTGYALRPQDVDRLWNDPLAHQIPPGPWPPQRPRRSVG